MALGALIVDDEADIRFLIRTIIELANSGLFVSGEAEDGADALDQIESLGADVVILDAMMPNMDGIAAAKAVRARWPNLPVIMCTAHATATLRAEAAAAGVRAFLTKEQISLIPETMWAVSSEH